MTQHRTSQHCTYCTYRHAAGTLTIRSGTAARREPVCWTCAREALTYYADQPARASFTTWPTP